MTTAQAALLRPGEALSKRPRPMWTRSFRYFLVLYRWTWKSSLALNFIYPVLYVTAMGVGLGGLVNHHLAASRAAALGGIPYLAFIAPGVLVSSAMQIGVEESTWPVYGATNWGRAYMAMLTTPLRVADVFYGHLAFMVARLATTTAIFLSVIAAFGAIRSPEALAAWPIGILVGMSFATPVAALSITRRNDAAFSILNRLVVVPLFLFSGSFFPITQLPRFLQFVALATPLYHGVALARAATLGHLASPVMLVHVAYLVALFAVGLVVARRNFERRLRQ